MFIAKGFGFFRASLRVAVLTSIGLIATACATTTEQPMFIAMSSEIVAPDGLQQFCIDHPDECGRQIVRANLTSSEPTAGQASSGPTEDSSRRGVNRGNVAMDAGIAFASLDIQGRSGQTPSHMNVASAMPRPDHGRVRIQADTQTMQLLQSVNRHINDQLEWVEDRELYGVEELWTLPITFGLSAQGDCEDFALEKRRALIANGISPGALSLATAYSPETGRHAVLIVHTSVGDLVLDNASPWIIEWSQTRYRWTGIQASADLMDWRMFATS
tara:strand:- start:1604 stop:2422 length:819 start_codon:yes stop_codon:yes gene_type:complete